MLKILEMLFPHRLALAAVVKARFKALKEKDNGDNTSGESDSVQVLQQTNQLANKFQNKPGIPDGRVCVEWAGRYQADLVSQMLARERGKMQGRTTAAAFSTDSETDARTSNTGFVSAGE